jgi:hypothetical protein
MDAIDRLGILFKAGAGESKRENGFRPGGVSVATS